ncbi:MAG: LamG-like jellyroll fold domain-containing protein [Bacteroidota bacterium]
MNKLLFLFCFLPVLSLAQAEYKFDFDNLTVGDANDAGDPTFSCGAIGEALELDGVDDEVNFVGPINNEFNTIDFSLSFYIRPSSFTGTQDILSKQENCTSDNAFSIQYNPNSRTILALLSESASKQVPLFGQLSDDVCWQHVAVVRSNNEFALYINGQLSAKGITSTRADISNTAPLSIADGPCIGATNVRYAGALDEFRVFSQALSDEEIGALYFKPDDITTRDTLLVLGDEVSIKTSSTCANSFAWTPVEGVTNPNEPNTTISPPVAGEFAYYLQFDDGSGTCLARDSIVIRVVSPEDLNCEEVFLPNAFTPNEDDLNDTYGISNPFVIEDLTAFEIFDRWGNRVFFTDDSRARWDGTFQSELVNPGVLFYRIQYNCRGEELSKTGSVMLLR